VLSDPFGAKLPSAATVKVTESLNVAYTGSPLDTQCHFDAVVKLEFKCPM